MKILVALHKNVEAQSIAAAVEASDHEVFVASSPTVAEATLAQWAPNLLITEDKFGREHADAGMSLAEQCRAINENSSARPYIHAVILARFADWQSVRRVRRTGAHVIVKTPNLDPLLRYVQTLIDDLVTDEMLGPVLFGIHRMNNGSSPFCERCEWVGASVAHGRSQSDVRLSPVRVALLNILLFARRGQSVTHICRMAAEQCFIRALLNGHTLRYSAIKMEMCRLREALGEALEELGAPYSGVHFLPPVQHGFQRYQLMANWRLVHIVHQGIEKS